MSIHVSQPNAEVLLFNAPRTDYVRPTLRRLFIGDDTLLPQTKKKKKKRDDTLWPPSAHGPRLFPRSLVPAPNAAHERREESEGWHVGRRGFNEDLAAVGRSAVNIPKYVDPKMTRPTTTETNISWGRRADCRERNSPDFFFSKTQSLPSRLGHTTVCVPSARVSRWVRYDVR